MFAADWQGQIEGVKYSLGGKFVASCVNCKFEIEAHNILKKKFASNVIGVIKGQVEPDR
jgi:hypothetical protein